MCIREEYTYNYAYNYNYAYKMYAVQTSLENSHPE